MKSVSKFLIILIFLSFTFKINSYAKPVTIASWGGAYTEMQRLGPAAYAEKKNPGKKRDTCISLIEISRSEFCTIAKKQISLTTTALKEKASKIIKTNPKEITSSLITTAKETSLIENIAKKSVIYNRR